MFELEQYYNNMTTKTTFPYKTLTKAFLRNFADNRKVTVRVTSDKKLFKMLDLM